MIKRLPKQIAIGLIRGYRYFLSPFFGQHCRFHPTCSRLCDRSDRTTRSREGWVVGVCVGSDAVIRLQMADWIRSPSPWTSSMITAEMQRILLLVALAATAYLLVLAWNDDYIKGRAAPGVIQCAGGNRADRRHARHVHRGASDSERRAESGVNAGARHRGSRSRACFRCRRPPRKGHDRHDARYGSIVSVATSFGCSCRDIPVSIEKPESIRSSCSIAARIMSTSRRADLVGRDGPDGKGPRPRIPGGSQRVRLSEVAES